MHLSDKLPRSTPLPRTGRPVKIALLSLIATLLALPLTGCSPAVQVDPAQDAANPQCAPMMIALPDSVAGQKLRDTTSQGTAAWGSPSKIILRCGVQPPGPTTDPCTSVNGVDWLISQDGTSQTWRATTFGRVPAVQVVFNQDQVASSTLLVDLAQPVSLLPQKSQCLNVDDAQIPQDTP